MLLSTFFFPLSAYIYIPSAVTIGRKHKAHRQQAEQPKPWRRAEKGRKGDKSSKQHGKDKSQGRGQARRSRMGQDESRMVDEDTPSVTLRNRSLDAVAEYIKEGRAGRIVVMVKIYIFFSLFLHV